MRFCPYAYTFALLNGYSKSIVRNKECCSPINNGSKSDLIYDREEVDNIINDWHFGLKVESPYLSKHFYLNRKVFATVNIQLNSEDENIIRVPLILSKNFPYLQQDRTVDSIDKALRQQFRIK